MIYANDGRCSSFFCSCKHNIRILFNLRRRKQPIEQAENYPNLYLIGALGSRGLTSAPFLGDTLASLIYGEPLPMSEDLIHN